MPLSPAYQRVQRDNLERQMEKLLALRDRLWTDCQEAVRLEYGSDDERLSRSGRCIFDALVGGAVAEVDDALECIKYYHGLDFPKKSFTHDEFLRIERLKELLA